MVESISPPIDVIVTRNGFSQKGTARANLFQNVPGPQGPLLDPATGREMRGEFLGVEVELTNGLRVYAQPDQIQRA